MKYKSKNESKRMQRFRKLQWMNEWMAQGLICQKQKEVKKNCGKEEQKKTRNNKKERQKQFKIITTTIKSGCKRWKRKAPKKWNENK